MCYQVKARFTKTIIVSWDIIGNSRYWCITEHTQKGFKRIHAAKNYGYINRKAEQLAAIHQCKLLQLG